MNTIKDNYAKNVNILKINLDRGLSLDQANDTIKHFKNTFKQNNLYGDDEVAFIDDMQQAVNKHFGIKEVKATDLMASMGIDVYQVN